MVDWITIAKDFGVPVAVMAALLTFMWITARAIWIGLVIPFRDVALAGLKDVFADLKAALKTMDENLSLVSRHVAAQTTLLERIDSKVCAQRDREIFNDVVDKAIKDAEAKAKNHK